MTKRNLALTLAVGLGLGASLAIARPAVAQEHAHQHMAMPTSGLRAELIRDVEQLEQKYVGLAEAMRGKYGWRPADGVRSVSEVFMHVAAANFTMPSMAGIQPPRAEELPAPPRELEKVTDEAKVLEVLKHSFMHARHAIARVPDAELEAAVNLFGREATKRAVFMTIVTHMHEHLGQLIAYARMNGVTPPWSAGASD
ncbi:MAG TPA: DinB family protein [Longimicrobiales bacterium]|nr:DinB family protein [Longimicrobiales bacterium]